MMVFPGADRLNSIRETAADALFVDHGPDDDIGTGEGGTTDRIIGAIFENPDEITVPLTGREIDPEADTDLPFGAPRDPLNFDPGPPGPEGGRDDPVIPRPPGGYRGLLVILVGLVGAGVFSYVFGQLVTVEL